MHAPSKANIALLNPNPGPGLKDIVTGTESFITADNYERIANAIDPDKGSSPDKPSYFDGPQGHAPPVGLQVQTRKGLCRRRQMNPSSR